jgi:hypothetical protein
VPVDFLSARARRRVAIAAGFATIAASIACSAVLGLDAPKLDPCADVACADGGAADGAGDAGDAHDVDARPDGSPGGLRCGGGTFGVTGCSGASPTCCQVTDDAGTTYDCRANAAACAGYPIACTSNADCPGNDVCCHSATQIKCVGSTSCANDSLVCEPDGAADQCPAGWTCTAAFTNAGVASPYFGCAP